MLQLLYRQLRIVLGIVLICTSASAAVTTPWSTGYFVSPNGWSHVYPMASTDIDYTALTHVCHFAARPNLDGTMDLTHYDLAATAAGLIAAAHAAGVKVILTVGGSGSNTRYRAAITAVGVSTFVANIMTVVNTYGYDGVDVDWETLDPGDVTQYTSLITTLRTSLNGQVPVGLLTAPVSRGPTIVAPLQANFDQINVMGYDNVFPDLGVSWHNAAVYTGTTVDPTYGAAYPTIDWRVGLFLSAGVAPQKLGLGMPFYGYVWAGGVTATGCVTDPGQVWTVAPSQTAQDYNYLMNNVYTVGAANWDSVALVPWLQFPSGTPALCQFVSYDDATSVAQKVAYAADKGLGGVMMFELAGGYFTSVPHHPLLTAIKNEMALDWPILTSLISHHAILRSGARIK